MNKYSHPSTKRSTLAGCVIAALSLGYAAQSAAHMELGGHLNVTASQLDTEDTGGNSEKVSDVNVTSLELGLVASPNRNADVNVVWLLEEEPGGGSPDQGFAVDQAFLTWSGTGRMLSERPDRAGLEDSPWYLTAGKIYIPFATNLEYHTFDVISEPQTLGLGETLESALQVGYNPADTVHVYGGIYGGRGADGNAAGSDDELNDLFLGVNAESDLGGVVVQWTNNINNSISLIDELDPTEDGNAGMTLYGHTNVGPAMLQLSYVSAQDEYTQGDFAARQPSAINAEVTFEGVGRWDITGVYSQTDEWFDHPENTYGVVFDTPLADGVTLSGEYLHREYDAALSSGADSEDLVAVRVSTEIGALIAGD